MNIVIYLIIALISGGLGFVYRYGDLSLLSFILRPVTFIIELFLGTKFSYHDNLGFVNEVYKVNIGRDCSGINFLIITLLMLTFSFISKIKGGVRKFTSLLIIIVASYGITIFANASRIIGAILIMDIPIFLETRYEGLLHQSIGVVVYFIYLLGTYILASKILEKWGK